MINIPRGDGLELVCQALRVVRVADNILAKATNGTVLAPRHSILLVQVALPDELFIESAWARWYLRPNRSPMTHPIILSTIIAHPDSLDALLLSEVLKVNFCGDFHFFLVLGLLQPKLLSNVLRVTLF